MNALKKCNSKHKNKLEKEAGIPVRAGARKRFFSRSLKGPGRDKAFSDPSLFLGEGI